MTASNYRGRFAPSPTGPLHFGSLIAALGSYLDAKHHNGSWLVRIEDLDSPRTVPGAADTILHTLESIGLHWDETVIYQSRRTAEYEVALHKLNSVGKAYLCGCTRKEIADSTLRGIEGQVYPGTCRNGLPEGRVGRAWRVSTDSLAIEFDDVLQGHIMQQLENDIGDFVVKRADGLFAYQLAVAVDDAFQNITHVVRGVDLLISTPRQIYLQQLLGLPTPNYLHLPVVTNTQGEKLSKQTLAKPVDHTRPAELLLRALRFMQQNPPKELSDYDVTSILNWAISNWDCKALNQVKNISYC
jgi:glutamyl-Q tRNA(Asp) synthetase